jgi:hypothetical protein
VILDTQKSGPTPNTIIQYCFDIYNTVQHQRIVHMWYFIAIRSGYKNGAIEATRSTVLQKFFYEDASKLYNSSQWSDIAWLAISICQKMFHFYTLLFSQCVQRKNKFKFRS